MTSMVRARLSDPRVITVALIAALALIPSFSAAPGLLAADSKLGLYLDPGSLISGARWAYDPQLFAGWVPHQQIGFAWPAGPWFWLGEQLGLATWVVHRLWIAGLLIAAGTGVAYCARRLGLSWTAAACAGIMYELSPYVLAYISRTSVMLLPWAGLGWIVGLTVMATRTRRWREPALLSLVILTVAGVNATAILMIAPAPLLWLVHTTWAGHLRVRAAAAVTARIAVLSTAVSAWWLVMLVIQRRVGGDVLGFSETLTDVSTSSTAPETLRGLGYWLFYIRDAFSATTEASLAHLGRTSIIALNFAFVIAGFAALATVRWAHRRFAAMLIATGVILAVGVHPIDDPAPLMSIFVGPDSESAVAVALRSSTRAVPMIVLGLALAVAARITLLGTGAAATRRDRTGTEVAHRTPVRAVAVVGLFVMAVVLNLPAWWTGGFVDPNLQRGDPPPSWVEAADRLNALPGDHRILQLPGTEFGAFRWGHTNDQPLTWMVDRPLIGRDLLPLGSPEVMDLIYAVDDRVQNQILEPASLPVIARLLGVDSIWVTNDVAHERYRSAPPEPLGELVGSTAGISADWRSAATLENRADPPRIDERSISDARIGSAVPEVELFSVDEPLGIVRLGGETIGLVGSGDGIIDAAAAGLIDGTETIIGDPSDLPAAATVERVIITDSDRSRPRHWRTSQDVTGATESADPRLSPLRTRPGDARLEFARGPQVTAEQYGAVAATATEYGPAFSYHAEYRPVMAVDGDPSTAWAVAASPVGQRLRLIIDEGVGALSDGALPDLVVEQIHDSSHMITEIAISADNGATITVGLDARSLDAAGQEIRLSEEFGDAGIIDIEILAVSERAHDTLTMSPRTAAVGFSRVDIGAAPTIEVVEIPDQAWSENVAPPKGTAVVLTRLRSDPMNRERADPERQLIRRFGTGSNGPYRIGVEISIDTRSSDEELIRLTGGRAISSQRLRGALNATASAAFDSDPATAWVSPFSPAGDLWLEFELDAATDTITISQPIGDYSTITEIGVSDTAGSAHTFAIDGATTDLEFPDQIGPGPVRIEITGIAPATVVDYRGVSEVVLPVAIAEIVTGSEVIEVPAQISTSCREDLLSINDVAVPIRIERMDVDGAQPTGAVSAVPCVDSIEIDTADNLLIGRAAGPLRIDRVVLTEHDTDVSASRATSGSVVATSMDPTNTRIELTGCIDGCWLIHGHGHNRGWRATSGDLDLGAPLSVSGGLNAWYLDATVLEEGSGTVMLRFGPQRWLDIAWVITAIGVLASAAVIVRSHRGRPATITAPSSWVPQRLDPSLRPTRLLRPIATALTTAVVAFAVIGPLWAVIGAVLALLGLRRDRAMEWFATFLVAGVATWIAVSNRIQQPPPDLAWPQEFSAVHPLALLAVVVMLGATLFADDAIRTLPAANGSVDDG